MDSLLEMFSRTGEASPFLVALSLLEPLLVLIAFVFIGVVSIRHYLKTKSLGALLIMSSLIGSIFISIIVTILESEVTSSSEVQVVLIGNAIYGLLFLVFAYGFKLVCKQAER